MTLACARIAQSLERLLALMFHYRMYRQNGWSPSDGKGDDGGQANHGKCWLDGCPNPVGPLFKKGLKEGGNDLGRDLAQWLLAAKLSLREDPFFGWTGHSSIARPAMVWETRYK